MALITKITEAGYKAAIDNSDGSGFNIAITAVESVSGGRVMGRFAANGLARNGANIILQAVIKSLKGEEYSFNKINLIESSGKIFATVENDDGSVIDSVTQHKNAILEYTLSYTLAEAGKITVMPIDASVFSVILHAADESAHQEQFAGKVKYSDIIDSLDSNDKINPVSAYQGAVLKNRLAQIKALQSAITVNKTMQGNDSAGRPRTGHIVKFPDGKIVQKFLYQGDIVKLTTNSATDANILNSRIFTCSLWEEMPTKITNVYANLAAIGNDGVTEHTGMNDGESSFWSVVWDYSISDSNTAKIFMRRVLGGGASSSSNPTVKIMITVEGY